MSSLLTASRWRSWFWLLPSLFLAFAIPAHAATTSTAVLDSDKDGLSDVLEVKFGTDINNPDTDGDTFQDGLEVQMAYSPTTTEPIALQKSIYVDLRTQTLEKRVMGIAVKTFLVSSGEPGKATPTGNFKILAKTPRAWSRLASLWMPQWMEFDARGYGIHELPEWPGGKKEGENHLGRPVSHGCVRLGVGPAKEMYDWAPIGTPVTIVRTPSVAVAKK